MDKPGSHTFLVKKQGYLEETSTASLQAGQIFHFAPTLKALGSTDDIKLGGKFKKLFGGGDTAGMGAVSVKTQPKGAQVAINNRILDKFSPVDFLSQSRYLRDRHHRCRDTSRFIASSKCRRAARSRSMRIWSGSKSI